MYGPFIFRTLLPGHCPLCLRHDPQREQLLLATPQDKGYTSASRCITCAMTQGDKRIRVGKKVTLGNY